MHITRRNVTIGGLSLLAGTSMSTMARAEIGEGLFEGLEEFWIATDAYVYGYPLVTMEITRRIMTNVATPAGNRGPMGEFVKSRAYPDATFRDVTAPNARAHAAAEARWRLSRRRRTRLGFLIGRSRAFFSDRNEVGGLG